LQGNNFSRLSVQECVEVGWLQVRHRLACPVGDADGDCSRCSGRGLLLASSAGREAQGRERGSDDKRGEAVAAHGAT
jgi:hypothetical protein